jgi:putative methyltransferase (TIGR04325 family)
MRELVIRVAARTLPPVLFARLRQIVFRLKLAEPRRIWRGVFGHVRDVPARGPGYADEAYRASAIRQVERLMGLGSRSQTALDDESGALLSLLCAAVSAQRSGPIRVLDFGGGPGLGYAQIQASLRAPRQIEYHVVELASVCADGRRLFGHDPQIQFHASIPSRLGSVDIVHAAGSLEAIEDWQGVLRALCRFDPPWVLLTGVYCGDFETFASALMFIEGSAIPVWLLNAGAIVDVMAECGYQLQFRALLERVHVQDNFPPSLRLPGGHPSAMLFGKSVD